MVLKKVLSGGRRSDTTRRRRTCMIFLRYEKDDREFVSASHCASTLAFTTRLRLGASTNRVYGLSTPTKCKMEGCGQAPPLLLSLLPPAGGGHAYLHANELNALSSLQVGSMWQKKRKRKKRRKRMRRWESGKKGTSTRTPTQAMNTHQTRPNLF